MVGRTVGMADELVAFLVDVHQSAEGALGALVLGAGIDHRALHAGKGRGVLVGLDQILADFRADQLGQPTDMTQHRVVAQDRVVRLHQVVDADHRQETGGDDQGPDPGAVTGKGAQAGEGQQTQAKRRVAAEVERSHAEVLTRWRATPSRLGARRKVSTEKLKLNGALAYG